MASQMISGSVLFCGRFGSGIAGATVTVTPNDGTPPATGVTMADGTFAIGFTSKQETIGVTVTATHRDMALVKPAQTSLNPRIQTTGVLLSMGPSAFPSPCSPPAVVKPMRLMLNSLSISDDTDPVGAGEIWVNVTITDLSLDFKTTNDRLLVPFRFDTVTQDFGPFVMNDGATHTFSRGEHVDIPSGPATDVLITITVRDDDSATNLDHDPFTVNSQGRPFPFDALGSAGMRLRRANRFGIGFSGPLRGALFTMRVALA